jgi:hypothetical protein
MCTSDHPYPCVDPGAGGRVGAFHGRRNLRLLMTTFGLTVLSRWKTRGPRGRSVLPSSGDSPGRERLYLVLPGRWTHFQRHDSARLRFSRWAECQGEFEQGATEQKEKALTSVASVSSCLKKVAIQIFFIRAQPGVAALSVRAALRRRNFHDIDNAHP